MNIVSIDAGFGYYKALVNGKSIKFSNVTGNYRPSENGLIGGNDNLSIEVEGLGAWNFGNTAKLQSSGGGSRKQSSDRIFSKEFLAGLLLSISEGYSRNTDRIEVDIITGLPGSDYNQYTHSDKIFQKKFKSFVTGSYHIHRPGYNQRIYINSIMCTSQAWGAIYRHLIDKDGNGIKPDIEINTVDIGNINIGFRTIENGTVEVQGIQNGSLAMVEAEGKSKSEPKGVHTITDSLIADLYKKFGIVYTTEKAFSIMESGKVLIDGDLQIYQLSDEIINSFEETCSSLATQVWNEDEMRSFYRIILTGGGANIVKNRFSHIPQLVMSDTPQWDTVEGYLRLYKAYKRSK